MIGDDKGLPGSISGLFVTAFSLYVRRFVLYGSLAFVAFAVQLIVDLLVVYDTGLATGLEIIVDAFVLAIRDVVGLAHAPGAFWSEALGLARRAFRG